MSGAAVRFVLADRALKHFKHGLQNLHKIGHELMLEAQPSRLSLRAINDSQSAYMSITYAAEFFQAYDVYNCSVTQAVLLLKHVLSVFRTHHISKLVFELKADDATVTVTLHCENGLLKSYKLPTVDGEVLQASVDRSSLTVCMIAETSEMDKLLSTFHSSLSELTITALAEGASAAGPSAGKSVQLRSYLDPTKQTGDDKSLHTLLSLDATLAFVSYSNSADDMAEATFNIKDFRAMLALCESLGSRIRLMFQGPGQPLVAEPYFANHDGQDAECEAELIVATLTENSVDQSEERNAAEIAPRNAPDVPAAAHTVQHRQFSGLQDNPDLLADGGGISDMAAAQELGLHANGGGIADDAFEREGDGIPNTPPEDQEYMGTVPGVIIVSHHL